MGLKKLDLRDIYATFDDTGALVFKDAKTEKILCWVNFMGVQKLKSFIEDNVIEATGGTDRIINSR